MAKTKRQNKGRKGGRGNPTIVSQDQSFNSGLSKADFQDVYELTLIHKGKISSEVEEITTIKKRQIQREKLFTVKRLTEFARFFFKIPCDIELAYDDGTILHGDAEIFDAERQNDRINVLFKHIKNFAGSGNVSDYREDAYFLQRNINFQRLCTSNTFESIILSLPTEYALSDPDIQHFKKEVRVSLIMVEDDKSYLIRKIIGYSVEEGDLLGIRNQFEIKLGGHILKADHAIVQRWNFRAILITEDKFKTLEEGYTQCFDQLRSYANSVEGQEFPIFYGIVSNYDRWRFCCYIRPFDLKKTDTIDAFHFSQEFELTVDLDQRKVKTPRDNIERLVGVIKALHNPEIDVIVAESLKLPLEHKLKVAQFSLEQLNSERKIRKQKEEHKKLERPDEFEETINKDQKKLEEDEIKREEDLKELILNYQTEIQNSQDKMNRILEMNKKREEDNEELTKEHEIDSQEKGTKKIHT